MIMKFRDYSCFYFAYDRKTKELNRNNNNSCWAGYSDCLKYDLKNIKTPKVIYISDYKEWSSVSAHKQMVYIINKITPCREIKIKDFRQIWCNKRSSRCIREVSGIAR